MITNYNCSAQNELHNFKKQYIDASSIRAALEKMRNKFIFNNNFDNDFEIGVNIFDSCETILYPYNLEGIKVKSARHIYSAKSLQNEISYLRHDYQRTKSASILLELSKLINKLYCLISRYASKKIAQIKKIKRAIKKSSLRDLRLIHRNIVKFLFKNMSDESGNDNNKTFAALLINCKSSNYYQNGTSYNLYKKTNS